jgi:GntR family transcriptional regulator, phosphonate transport system regulatory protein
MDATHPADPEGEPLWRRIERTLQGEIATGLLAPGARMPSEPELASRFAAHRHTVRRAVAALAQRGLVRVEQGRGSFVHDDVISYAVGRRTRVEENLLRQNRAFAGRLLSAREELATPEAAKRLGLRGRAPRVLVVETLNEADGVPVSLVRHVLPAARFAAFPDAYRRTGSMTEALAACGVTDFARRGTRVSTRLPTAEEAKLLRQPPVLPVLVSESIEAESDGRAFKLGMARFAGERVHLVLDAP